MAMPFQDTLPSHGEPCLISEILCQLQTTQLHGKRVRVTGMVKNYDPHFQVLLLKEPYFPVHATSSTSTATSSSTNSNVLVVDTHLTSDLNCHPGAQIMFIGELEKLSESRLRDLLHADFYEDKDGGSEAPAIILKAVVSKSVDLLDYKLYLRCLSFWK